MEWLYFSFNLLLKDLKSTVCIILVDRWVIEHWLSPFVTDVTPKEDYHSVAGEHPLSHNLQDKVRDCCHPCTLTRGVYEQTLPLIQKSPIVCVVSVRNNWQRLVKLCDWKLFSSILQVQVSQHTWGTYHDYIPHPYIVFLYHLYSGGLLKVTCAVRYADTQQRDRTHQRITSFIWKTVRPPTREQSQSRNKHMHTPSLCRVCIHACRPHSPHPP